MDKYSSTLPGLDDDKGESGFGSKARRLGERTHVKLAFKRIHGMTRMLRAKCDRPKGNVKKVFLRWRLARDINARMSA